jgi:hypothetical protein
MAESFICRCFEKLLLLLLLLLLFNGTANGVLPGGSDTPIGHHTKITHTTQNNTQRPD